MANDAKTMTREECSSFAAQAYDKVVKGSGEKGEVRIEPLNAEANFRARIR